jgi:hypothetical protein
VKLPNFLRIKFRWPALKANVRLWPYAATLYIQNAKLMVSLPWATPLTEEVTEFDIPQGLRPDENRNWDHDKAQAAIASFLVGDLRSRLLDLLDQQILSRLETELSVGAKREVRAFPLMENGKLVGVQLEGKYPFQSLNDEFMTLLLTAKVRGGMVELTVVDPRDPQKIYRDFIPSIGFFRRPKPKHEETDVFPTNDDDYVRAEIIKKVFRFLESMGERLVTWSERKEISPGEGVSALTLSRAHHFGILGFDRQVLDYRGLHVWVLNGDSKGRVLRVEREGGSISFERGDWPTKKVLVHPESSEPIFLSTTDVIPLLPELLQRGINPVTMDPLSYLPGDEVVRIMDGQRFILRAQTASPAVLMGGGWHSRFSATPLGSASTQELLTEEIVPAFLWPDPPSK